MKHGDSSLKGPETAFFMALAFVQVRANLCKFVKEKVIDILPFCQDKR
nr:MAG TPA: hypothetical protein [Caudoviricetes sp.]